jgi:hypothetical protein
MFSIAVDTPKGRGILVQFVWCGVDGVQGVVMIGGEFHSFRISFLKFIDWR